MRKRVLVCFGLVLSLSLITLICGCCINVGDLFKAKHEKTEQATVDAASATELDVQTDVGSVTITGTDETECNITAQITVKVRTKERARELAEQVRIETGLSDGKLTIRTTKPDALRKRGLEVHFTITAPKQLNLYCSTHVGEISISDIRGRIGASANVGRITCKKVVGAVDIGTNVGSVDVDYADDAPAACHADIRSNVGSIEFSPPPEVSAEVNASTNVGSLSTARPLTILGKVSRSLSGTIGAGEGSIRLKTNVGSIDIE
ncbi:MAG: DUF4097 family beta strand repeat protein [Phycisphaerales bacterium]|nr:MAG: DUF4097 family beta strand repeat protein [Phycisphaerales bacterium]